MNRREFIQRSTAFAGAMYMGMPAFADTVQPEGDPNLVIGVLSDIHLRGADTNATFIHALEYYRSLRVDGVIIAGDMADGGLISQLQVVADAWFKVFPDNKGLDGKQTEQLFIYGNHDVGNSGSSGIAPRRAEAWQTCFRESFSDIWMKTIKGYHFIGAHWENQNNISGLAAFLQEHNEELTGDKPFFYIQHPHPKDTCNCAWAWGRDDGTVTRLLSKYPNAVAFSGHSHSPLDDDRNFWQDSFTSIGTSSLSYLYPMPARENTHQDDLSANPPSQMANMSTSDGRQGMVMRIYDNAITFERKEFVYDEPIGDDWVMPWPISTSAPLTFANRAKTAAVPQFPKGTKPTVTAGEGTDRYGTSQQQITVHFPNVLKKDTGVRAFDYQVQVEYTWLDVNFVTGTKRVFSPHCYLGEQKDTDEVVCVYGTSELPKDFSYRFAIRPCNCYGAMGDPIYSDYVSSNTIASRTASLKLYKQFYKMGGTFIATIKDAPVGTNAWIGIYAWGKNPGSGSPSIVWTYTKVAEGTLTLKLDASKFTTAGQYYAVLFQDDGYTECSQRVAFFVMQNDYDPSDFKMTTDKEVYTIGEPINVALANAPAIYDDWVGIYPVGTEPKDSTCPTYLYNTDTNGTLQLNVSGTKNWTEALPAGEYFVGYFMAGDYTEPFDRQYFKIVANEGDGVSAVKQQARANATYRLDGSIALNTNQPGVYIRDGKKHIIK